MKIIVKTFMVATLVLSFGGAFAHVVLDEPVAQAGASYKAVLRGLTHDGHSRAMVQGAADLREWQQ